MWAPVFYDPDAGIADGSLGWVPATKSHLLRGLNSTMPCVNSAEVVISPLFEKKRSVTFALTDECSFEFRAQICAVWVTNGGTAQSPFSVLNNSVRKYDSLRGKYIYSPTSIPCVFASERPNLRHFYNRLHPPSETCLPFSRQVL